AGEAPANGQEIPRISARFYALTGCEFPGEPKWLVVLLCCRCCQALFTHLFFPLFFILRSRFPSDALVFLKYLISAHMSRHCNRFEAAGIRYGSCHHPGLNLGSSRSHGLNQWGWRLPLALRPQVSN